MWWECLSKGMSKVPGSAGSAGAARLASRECVWWSEVKQGVMRAKAPHRHTCHASHGNEQENPHARQDAEMVLLWVVCRDARTSRGQSRGGRPGARAAPRHRRAARPPHPREGEGRTAHRFVRWCVCLIRIFGTKAEPQRIVATRPLCLVQHPVPHSSRLQGIHRVGPVTCDRVRLRPKLGVLAAERPTR